jgi:hypothetical protein
MRTDLGLARHAEKALSLNARRRTLASFRRR